VSVRNKRAGGRLTLGDMSQASPEELGPPSREASSESESDVPEPESPSVAGEPVAPENAARGHTGDDRVDEALTRLSELDDKPVQEHAAVVEEIHRALQDTLAEEEA
jgi:hypothetical protein